MSAPNRLNLLKRNLFCTYCERQVDVCTGTLDHQLPKCKGGKNNNNLVLACKKCNGIKGCFLLDYWEQILPMLREAGYFFMSKRQRQLWRKDNPKVLPYAMFGEPSSEI